MEELRDYRAEPPVGIDPIGASTDATALLYKVIREDIVSGRLKSNQRLVVADLAKRHGSSTTPVREVLQLLRGEGFVVFTRNRGARVRPIDRDFIRDIYEIGVLIEPALTRWFVGWRRKPISLNWSGSRARSKRTISPTRSSTATSTPSSTP